MINNNNIRIAICDDHPVIRFGLSQVINNEEDLEVSLEAATPQALINDFEEHSPDITILDLELGNASGIDCLKEIRQLSPAAKVIIYTAHGESDRIMEAIDLGIQGYLLKESECSDIINSIRIVHNGGTSLEPGIATKLLDRMRNETEREINVLSRRETEVLVQLAQGKTNRDIASTLFISERTVKFHVSSILDKLHVRNRTEAALYARQNDIYSVENRKQG